jgi:uncharacterized protein YfaS (alpha-2-macroglobulin family)
MNSLLRIFSNTKNIIAVAILFVLVVCAGMVAILLADQSQDKPDTNVKVESFQPTEYLNILEPTTNIVVKFSRDLMPDDSLNILTAESPFDIDPPISGLGRWTDNNQFTFYPDSLFRPSTEYTVKIRSDRIYLFGNRIKESREFKFHTPALIVTSFSNEIAILAEPAFQSKLLIHVGFYYMVDPKTLMDHFYTNIKGKHGDLRFEIKETQPSKTFTFISEPFEQDKINGEFLMVISKGLNCVNGQIPMAADYRQLFTIQAPGPLVINAVQSEGSGENSRITIDLAETVPLDEFKKYVSISPNIDFVIDQDYNRINLIGNFKPRETYTVNIQRGMHALNGQLLQRDFSSKVLIADLRPNLHFVDPGQYMSKKSQRLLAVETTNLDEITVVVEQVFPNNIVYYLGGDPDDTYRVGRHIFSKDYKLASTLNVPLTSTIDIGQIVGDSLQGIYAVSIHSKDRYWESDARRVMITDLGIMARLSDNYLMVWVNSLSGTGPISGAHVTLISSNNQILLEGQTDSRGVVVFENIIDKTKGFQPFVITVSKDKDLSYLQFNDCMIYTADFDVSGRPYLTHGYESFIYSDRGVYRPGETAHLVSVVRGINGSVVQEFPYIINVKDPQGRDFQEYKLTSKDAAFSAFDVEVPDFAKTGNYLVTAKIGDDVIGQYQFQVEEFMPDRIKATISTDKESYNSGDSMNIIVNGTYLFGPLCAGNTVDGHITLQSDYFRPQGWSEYAFADPSIKFTAMQVDLPTDKLDDKGNHTYNYQISKNLRPPSSIQLLLSATVLEDGGRAVSAYKTITANPYPIYFGIKQATEGYAQVGQKTSFNVIALDGNGTAVSVDSAWVKFYRTVYQNIVKKDENGIYRYVSEEKDQIIDSALISIGAKAAIATFTPSDYGSFKVKITSARSEHTSALEFYAAGWGYSPWSMANPDRLEMELDKKLYAAGDKAKLLIKAPFEGRLLLTIEKDKVLEFKTYDLDSNTAEIDLPVKKEYAPNVYVTGTLIKSTTSLERYSPPRAFGMVPLIVDNSNMKLQIAIEAPSVMKPRQKLDIKLTTNLKKGTKVTVAAVDVGILQLTDFKTPDPFDFFYGKKRPALQPYDIYSQINPDIKAAESKLTPGGSAAYDAARKRHLNPLNVRRVKPVALWSGVIEIDESGIADVSFDIPQFNGKLAIMAVGFNGEKCGSATGEVTVRDKIVIQESLPRFIANDDKISTGVVVFNNTEAPDSFDVAMKITGSAVLTSKDFVRIAIPNNGKAIAKFVFRATNKPGKVTFDITATNGTDSSHETVELANRPGQPLLTKHGAGSVRDGTPVHLTMPTNWLEGTGQYELRLSSLPAVRLAGGIQYLLGYPYGCIEQTTSRLFPLLYFNDLAKFVQPEIFGGKGQDYFIVEGILKLSSMQLQSGEFTFWQGGSYSKPWGSIYASHFLVEARKAGYQVRDDVYDRALDNLQRIAKDETLGEGKVVLRIYAAYVLAKAGKLDKSIVNNLKMLNLEVIPLYSKFQLAAAIAMTSGVNDALWLIPIEIHPEKYDPETGEDFDSDVRANSILLEVLTEVAPENPSIPELVKDISEKLYIGEWYTTQSNSWALMAIGKYLHAQERASYTGTIVVDGKKLKTFGAEDVRIADPSLGGKDISISINGTGACYYYWQASGVSTEQATNEFDNRMRVRREYLDAKGDSLNFGNIKLGDQIVAKITAVALDKPLENVVINDLLPSCLEIENPRLQTSGKMNWLPQSDYYPSYMDIRDDRLLLFTDLQVGNRIVFYYSLRVVSAGDFNVPPVAGECMYDPTIASAASSRTMTVIGGE